VGSSSSSSSSPRQKKKTVSSPSDAIVLTDVFARVGGPNTSPVGPVSTMFLINHDNVIIDNTWLWRADHTIDGLVYHHDNPVKNGLVVNGDDVYAYGLASEHTIEDNVVWNGDNGLTYFYQAEILYDSPLASSSASSSLWNHSCYKLGADVRGHYATGLGCYSYFRDASCYANRGIDTSVATSSGVVIDKAMSVWLNGEQQSGIRGVVDDDGEAVDSEKHIRYHCDKSRKPL
jgi:hypothetical protein